jgi:hypothetical protein
MGYSFCSVGNSDANSKLILSRQFSNEVVNSMHGGESGQDLSRGQRYSPFRTCVLTYDHDHAGRCPRSTKPIIEAHRKARILLHRSLPRVLSKSNGAAERGSSKFRGDVANDVIVLISMTR